MRKLLCSVAACGLSVSTAQAATFVVTFNSSLAVPSNNDFKAKLATLGLTRYTTSGAAITLFGNARVKFEYMGSESGFIDRFTAVGTDAIVTGLENNADNFAAPVNLGSANFLSGSFAPSFTSNGNGGVISIPGMDSFGILMGDGITGAFQSNVLYFGFDDQVTNIDDNHDDFIVRATIQAVPEPATWAMMITGFGLTGAAVRRRRHAGSALQTA